MACGTFGDATLSARSHVVDGDRRRRRAGLVRGQLADAIRAFIALPVEKRTAMSERGRRGGSRSISLGARSPARRLDVIARLRRSESRNERPSLLYTR